MGYLGTKTRAKRSRYLSENGELLFVNANDQTIYNGELAEALKSIWSSRLGENFEEECKYVNPHMSKGELEIRKRSAAFALQASANFMRETAQTNTHFANHFEECARIDSLIESGEMSLEEAPTTNTNLGAYVTNVMSLQRRQQMLTISPSVATVNPMLSPIGAFALFKPRYGTSRGAITEGDEVNLTFDPNYTKDQVVGESMFTSDGSTVFFGVEFSPKPTASSMKFFINNVQVGTDNGAGGLTGLSGGLAGASASINYVTGVATFTLASALAVGTEIAVSYDWNSEGSPDMVTYTAEVQLMPIQVRTRKALISSTMEANQDFSAHWGSNLHDELIMTAMQDFTLSKDREILRKQYRAVLENNRSSYVHDISQGISHKQQLQELRFRINQLRDVIEHACKKRPTYMVTSMLNRSLFEDLEGFQLNPMGGYDGDMGKVVGGVYQSDLKIYFIDGWDKNKCLMGYNPSDPRHAGTIFSPYVDEAVDKFTDPSVQISFSSIMSRYAVQVLRPEYYGVFDLTVST